MTNIGQPDMRTPKVFRYEGKDYVSMDEYLRLGAQYRDFYSPQWIPVEERLPEMGEWVLCYSKNRGCETARVEKHWYGWVTKDLKNLVPDAYTHWMPVPQPPEEEA